MSEALSDSGWRSTMQEEIATLEQNRTWDLIPLQPEKKTVVIGFTLWNSIWMVPLAAWSTIGNSQMYDIEYREIFSTMAKVTSIRLLIHFLLPIVAITSTWHQECLHDILDEVANMEQPLGFVAQRVWTSLSSQEVYTDWNSLLEHGLRDLP